MFLAKSNNALIIFEIIIGFGYYPVIVLRFELHVDTIIIQTFSAVYDLFPISMIGGRSPTLTQITLIYQDKSVDNKMITVGVVHWRTGK